jgi:hypothetical protein
MSTRCLRAWRLRLIAAASLGVCLASTAWAQQSMGTAAAASSPQATAAAPAADASPVKVTPYGTIYFNFFDNSDGTNNADVPLWATPGTGNLSASARQTRLGLRVTGVTAANAKVSAVVEVDFYGGFPSTGIGDNMGVVRLRLANVRLDWSHTSLILGQDWMVFAPVNPTSIAAAGIPLMAAAGNPWARLPQARVEWHDGHVLLQSAVLAPSTGDFSSTFAYVPASGSLSQVPFLQGRAAFTSSNWMDTKKPASIGVSGHYGRSRVITAAADRTFDSRAVAADWSVPIVNRLTLAGEVFTGRDLAGFQAGVFQGVNTNFAVITASGPVDDGGHAIETRGGWAQLSATVIPPLSVQLTWGLDDPRDETLVSVSRTDWRLRNQATAIGFVHKLSSQISWGVEYHRIVTAFLLTGRHTDNHINLAATFTF